jgi:hypothetical protein
MATTKAEVLTTTGTSIGSILKSWGTRAADGFATWYRKGQLGDDGRSLARATGVRC